MSQPFLLGNIIQILAEFVEIVLFFVNLHENKYSCLYLWK